MADKKQKRPIEAISGLYSAIPHTVLDSVAFKGASYPAKALIFELMRQHDGKNNGHLHLSFSWLAGRCWKSRDVIQRASSLSDLTLNMRESRLQNFDGNNHGLSPDRSKH